MKFLIPMATLVAFSSVSANVLYDAGTGVSYTYACDSGPDACLLIGGDYWTIYDDFSLQSDAKVSGFSFVDAVFHGTPAENYVSTTWSLYASDPSLGAGAIASGTAVASVSPYPYLSAHQFDVEIPSIELSAGVYWLGISNTLTMGAESTPVGTESTLPSLTFGFYQYSPTTSFWHQNVGDRSMQVYGISAVPEPSVMPLLALGLLGLAWGVTRRRQ